MKQWCNVCGEEYIYDATSPHAHPYGCPECVQGIERFHKAHKAADEGRIVPRPAEIVNLDSLLEKKETA